MNLNYHLTVEEARDGLDGILPLINKGALRIGGLFTIFSVGLVIYMAVNGFQWSYLLIVTGCLLASVWFFMNRKLNILLVGGRAAGDYMIIISPDGWLKSGKAEKKIRFTKDAYGAETELTVSFKPDTEHIYVIPKKQMNEKRAEELIQLLDSVKCPVRRLGEPRKEK